MSYGIHKLSQVAYIKEGLRALSRTTSGGTLNASTYATTTGTTTYLGSEVMDLTLFDSATQLLAIISAGAVATSLDARWVESDDKTTWTAVAATASITQLTAPGEAKLEVAVRHFTKRYAMYAVVLGGTCVFSCYILGFKSTV